MMENGSGTSITVRWIMGVMSAMIAVGFAAWLNTTYQAVDKVRDKSSQTAEEVSLIKGQLPAVKEQLIAMRADLKEMNAKLDSLIRVFPRATTRSTGDIAQ